VQQVAAVVSVLSMGLMILIQLRQDAVVLSTQTLSQRIEGKSLTSIELLLMWGIVGAVLYQLARMQRGRRVPKVDADGD
jgi:hypothetical protein